MRCAGCVLAPAPAVWHGPLPCACARRAQWAAAAGRRAARLCGTCGGDGGLRRDLLVHRCPLHVAGGNLELPDAGGGAGWGALAQPDVTQREGGVGVVKVTVGERLRAGEHAAARGQLRMELGQAARAEDKLALDFEGGAAGWHAGAAAAGCGWQSCAHACCSGCELAQVS